MRKISILGSTGSIGTQTLEVVENLGDIRVAAITGNKNITLLEKQARKFQPELVAVMDAENAKALQSRLSDTKIRIVSGMDGLVEAATYEDVDTVVTSVVGNVGLQPTFAAIRAGKNIALANKETLVSAGQLVMDFAKQHHVRIYPVDSEHSAIFQSLQGNAGNRISRILLTASGGPFFGKKIEEMRGMTREQALAHPNWSMGAKITIDSATMINKGLEMIEAKWLFDVELEQIEVVVHPQSVIHSAVQYEDGAVIAQLGTPDMRLPIQYALSFPERMPLDGPRIDFAELGCLEFFKPDTARFPNLGLAFECLRRGGNAGGILNAANEIAVAAFLDGQIGFTDIPRINTETLARATAIARPTLDQYRQTDAEAREIARSLLPAQARSRNCKAQSLNS